MKKAAIVVAIFLCFRPLSFSQVTPDSLQLPAGRQLFELLPARYLWMNTSNPAALSDLTFKRFSIAETGYLYEDKEMKYTHQPGTTSSFQVGTKGYRIIGNASFYGSFRYNNSTFKDILFNSTLEFDDWNPILVFDTIVGSQTKEEFDISGALSYRLSDRLSVGGAIDYVSAVGAKHRDPRNDNTISHFCFSPGIMYRAGKFTLGLSGSLYSHTNDVDIDVIESNSTSKFSIFRFTGMAYYEEEVSATSYSTRFVGKGASATGQVSYKSGKIENLLSVSVVSENQERRYGSSFRLTDGGSRKLNMEFADYLMLSGERFEHRITLKGLISHIYGNDQYDYETVWHTYQGIPYSVEVFKLCRENAVILTDNTGEVAYQITDYRSNGMKNLEAGASVKVDYIHHSRYPVVTDGNVTSLNLIARLGIRKTFTTGKAYLSPSVEGYYQKNLSSSIQYLPPMGVLVMPEIMILNYYVMKAPLYGAKISLETEIPGKKEFIKSYYFKPEGGYYYSSAFADGTGRNVYCRISGGFTF